MQCLTDRVCRLAPFESESQRKDAVIAELRKELAAYKKNPMAKDLGYVNYVESKAEILKRLHIALNYPNSVKAAHGHHAYKTHTHIFHFSL